MPLVYLESSALFSWALEDKHYWKIKPVIDGIKAGTTTGMTSSLAVMETIDVMRKRITERAPFQGDSRSTNLNSLKLEIDRAIQEFMNALTALVGQGKIIWDDPPLNMDQVLEEALEILKQRFGHFWTAYKCNRCEGPIDPPEYFYRGIGHYDIQHALLAKELHAESLLTLDQFFNDLNSIPAFSTLRFDVR